jgi:hypothetical protein
MGLIAHIFRLIRNYLGRFWAWIKRKPEKEETKIPGQWAEKEESPMAKGPEPMARPSSLVVKKGRKLHIRWLLSIKRLIAALLMCTNFVLAEFILGTQTPGAVIFVFMFLANSFIEADYLWKTRSKKQ